MMTAPKAPMAHAQAVASPGREPWGREGKGDAAEGLQGAVAEQGGVLFDAGVDRGEGGMGAEHVERGRLVELGDDESEECVHSRQVDVGEEVAERSFRTDEEDEQKADDERRHHQREHDAELDDAGERQTASGEQVGERGAEQHHDPEGDRARSERDPEGVQGSGRPERRSDGLEREVLDQHGEGAEQGKPDHEGTQQRQHSRAPGDEAPGGRESRDHPGAARLPAGVELLIRTRLYHLRPGTRSTHQLATCLPACPRSWHL